MSGQSSTSSSGPAVALNIPRVPWALSQAEEKSEPKSFPISIQLCFVPRRVLNLCPVQIENITIVASN